ncbi:transglutaminase-like domain-containing protein [Devosia sp. CN2-171]|uniref:transglutaminase-like domain-containing protein n=1 Tax=Devosia sp. CN2-171 TaxID=3400909 RepID=UPI003BF85EE0
MRFSVGCELQYEAITETTLILNIEAQRSSGQRLFEDRYTGPSGDVYEVPETGNRYRRLILAPGTHNFRYRAIVDTHPVRSIPDEVQETPVGKLPFDVLPHLYASRYCPSDLMARFAWRQFGNLGSGHEKVQAICNWIFENVDYLEGSSDGSTSAHDTFTLRAGVCRDFAHLGITLTRAVGIPARFVSAYALELTPQDFHAVFEAYLGGRWYLFDATRLCPIDGIIKIGVGRDAADTAFATYFGQLTGPPKVVTVERLGNVANQEWTVDAVSLSRQ